MYVFLLLNVNLAVITNHGSVMKLDLPVVSVKKLFSLSKAFPEINDAYRLARNNHKKTCSRH